MISPVILEFGPFQIRWYGVILVLGFIMGALIAIKLGKKKGIQKDQVYDFLLYLIPLSIIFARIFHVFVYNFNFYINNPGLIVQIWHGGISLFGGLVGAVIAGALFCRKHKIKFYDLADVFIIPFTLGITFGRFGNFINQELYGKVTNLPWGVVFDNVVGKRHPTQIYEAIGHFTIFLILLKIWKKNYSRGVVFYSFLIIYPLFRFFMEFLREDNAVFLGMTTTQVFIIPLLIFAVIMLRKSKNG